MKDFAAFVIARHPETQSQVLAALETQRRSRPPIGRLALQSRMLDSAQVFTILAHQARHAPIRFGEAAVDLGMLTREEVERLLRLQRTQAPPLEELLVKSGALDEATARELRRAYELEHPTHPSGTALRAVAPRSRRSA